MQHQNSTKDRPKYRATYPRIGDAKKRAEDGAANGTANGTDDSEERRNHYL